MSDQPEIPPQPSSPVPPPMAPPSAPPSAPPPVAPPSAAWTPGAAAPAYSPSPGLGKSRVVAIVLALFLGWIGIHKFYLGKVAQGVIYALFFWTGIPGIIALIEAMTYLVKSNEAWAAEYGGPVEQPSGVAIGCLWLIALASLISFVGTLIVISLIFLGAAVSSVSTY